MCEITLSIEANNDLLMTVTPNNGVLTTNLESLFNAFESSAYAQYALIENAIEQLFSEFIGDSTPAPLPSKKAHSKIIACSLDATLTILLSEDQMSASLTLTAAQGGKPLSCADVGHFLKRNGVIKGIDIKNIKYLVSQGLSVPAGDVVVATVATGKQCQHGNDGFIDYLVADPIHIMLQPKELGNGNVDMRELGGVIHVTKGDKLALLVPPTTGNRGFTVTGIKIEAKAGVEYFIEEAEGSSFIDDTKTLLIANISGMPKHLNNSVSVVPLLETDHIDVSTGNIRFDGSIFVKGDVREKMKLYATCDVIVGGVVEAELISAKGDICIAQGIIGHQIEDQHGQIKNSTKLQTKGDINAQFVQYADLTAHKNISVTHYISHSQISVQGKLWVGKSTTDIADGKLFGSHIQAGTTISVGVLGSLCGDSTSIDYNYWSEKQIEITKKNKKKLKALMNKSQKISNLIIKLSSNNNQEKQHALLLRLDNALKQHLALVVKYQEKIISLENNSSNYLEQLAISAYKGIFTGVNITIADKNCSIKREHDATSIIWQDNQIIFDPIVTTVNR